MLGPSYRPISLRCPAVKVLERLLLPELNNHLPVAPTQHGFRPNQSTTTTLLPFTHQITWGFNQRCPPYHTVTTSIDLSKAFDMVIHTKLISAPTPSPFRPNTKHWLSAYLQGWMTYVRYNHASSLQWHTRTGVPRGSYISPVLFNFFVSTYPRSDHLTTSYANDFTDSQSSTDYTAAASDLSEQVTQVSQWAEEYRLALSAPKSTVTLFNSDKRQSNATPQITLNNSTLSLERHPPRPSFHLRPTHQQPRLLHHSPPQHFKSSCWH